MWIITYRDKPVTLRQAIGRPSAPSDSHLDVYVVARLRTEAIQAFVYHAGYTWAEHRKDGYACQHINWL